MGAPGRQGATTSVPPSRQRADTQTMDGSFARKPLSRSAEGRPEGLTLTTAQRRCPPVTVEDEPPPGGSWMPSPVRDHLIEHGTGRLRANNRSRASPTENPEQPLIRCQQGAASRG